MDKLLSEMTADDLAKSFTSLFRPDIELYRQDIAEEALTWLGTPFAHQQRLKGVGADCVQWIDQVYVVALRTLGWQPHDFGNYPVSWMLHGTEEIFLNGARKMCREVAIPLHGDMALFKYRMSRTYSHGAIVLAWPKVIHADPRKGVNKVSITDASQPPLSGHEPFFFTPFK